MLGRLRCVRIELKLLPDLRGHNWPIKLAESVISLAMMMADDAVSNKCQVNDAKRAFLEPQNWLLNLKISAA